MSSVVIPRGTPEPPKRRRLPQHGTKKRWEMGCICDRCDAAIHDTESIDRTRYRAQHRMADIGIRWTVDSFGARSVECSCGWRSGFWSTPRLATQEWELHRDNPPPVPENAPASFFPRYVTKPKAS